MHDLNMDKIQRSKLISVIHKKFEKETHQNILLVGDKRRLLFNTRHFIRIYRRITGLTICNFVYIGKRGSLEHDEPLTSMHVETNVLLLLISKFSDIKLVDSNSFFSLYVYLILFLPKTMTIKWIKLNFV